MDDVVAGGVAGTIGVLVGVPFDTVKVRMQSMPTKFTSTWQTFRHTVKHEGVFSLFRGCLPPVSAQTIINALIFAGERSAMRFLEPDLKVNEHADPLNIFLAGSFGGFVQCFALVPTDLIKCKLQVDSLEGGKNKYGGVLDCIRQVIASDGPMGLFRGFGVTVLREVPSFGIYFSTYRFMKRLLANHSAEASSSSWGTLMAGGVAGSVTWFSIYPLDVIKSNVQTSSLPASTSTWGVAMALLRERGPLFFYRGLGVTIARAFPVNAVTFYFYELFTSWIHTIAE